MSQNRLVGETSPYLQQHADNPVDWYAWSEEALQRARDENKPILLSIGYSACHWCHVMAHESFEDEETAALMNEYFINIKVDREERPDIDRIYQTAQHLLTQRNGGWPLTMFLTPDDQIPFFGGTYFPKQAQYNLPGFKDLLKHIHKVYSEDEAAIRSQNSSMLDALKNIEIVTDADSVQLEPGPLQTAMTQYQNSFNQRSGGFGGAPKFPQPGNLEFLLKYSANQIDELSARDEALGMALYTLEKMARGGIYDHIGGGFARYSVDDEWMIPHFEKMLYDNGPLLVLCTQAWQLTGDDLFRDTVVETVEWVKCEMQSLQGGFYSSLDADSEGEEGKFYVWEQSQVIEVLDEQQYRLFAYQYGLDSPANFEGKWHLFEQHTLAETAQEFSISEQECLESQTNSINTLFKVREKRIRPGRDDKILTAWNALMIRGLAEAGRVFQTEHYIDSAIEALDSIRQTLWVDGQLLATSKGDKAHLNAYLDDHALLLEAILSVLQAHWQSEHLFFAIELAEALLARFADPENGGFFFTSHDHEKLIQRNKPWMDETLPSGNGTAARALNLLGHLIGEPRYLDAASKTIKASWQSLQRIPYAHGSTLCALLDQLAPPEFIILQGNQDEMRDWQFQIQALGFQPNRYVFAINNDSQTLPGVLARPAVSNTTSAQICIGDRCLEPVTKLEPLLNQLKNTVE